MDYPMSTNWLDVRQQAHEELLHEEANWNGFFPGHILWAINQEQWGGAAFVTGDTENVSVTPSKCYICVRVYTYTYIQY